LSHGVDECIGSAREGSVTAVSDSEFTPEFFAFDGDQLHASGEDLIFGEAGADDGNAEAGGNETLDHANTWQLHANLHLSGVGTKELVHDAAAESGLGQQNRIFRDLADRHDVELGQCMRRTDHQHELIAKNCMRFKAGTLDRHGDDADINGAVLKLLDNFVAEISIDTDLHAGIKAAIFRENIRKNVKASGFVRAYGDGATRHVALVGDSQQRLVLHLQHAFGVSEKDAAGGRESDVFAGAVKQAIAVFLFELTYLRADRGLRAEDFLPGAREAAKLGDFHEGDELVKIHGCGIIAEKR